MDLQNNYQQRAPQSSKAMRLTQLSTHNHAVYSVTVTYSSTRRGVFVFKTHTPQELILWNSYLVISITSYFVKSPRASQLQQQSTSRAGFSMSTINIAVVARMCLNAFRDHFVPQRLILHKLCLASQFFFEQKYRILKSCVSSLALSVFRKGYEDINALLQMRSVQRDFS